MPRQSNRFFAACGLAAGAATSLALSVQRNQGTTLLMAAAGCAVCAPAALALLWLLRECLRRGVERFYGKAVAEEYRRADWWTYGVALLTLTSALGVQLIAPVWCAFAVLFAGAQAAVLRRARRTRRTASDLTAAAPLRSRVLVPLFFLSGLSALIYQVAWQRTLYTHFGVNMTSVTIIVSVFMFGLGLGALAGGRLSRQPIHALPWLFVATELGVGLFGAMSIPLILHVGAAVERQSMLVITLSVFAVLGIPTLFMGATLPILVAYVHRDLGDVEHSVARLYFVNTLGSAAACFLTVDVLFAFTGLRGSTLIAAACNLAVAALVAAYAREPRPDVECVPLEAIA